MSLSESPAPARALESPRPPACKPKHNADPPYAMGGSYNVRSTSNLELTNAQRQETYVYAKQLAEKSHAQNRNRSSVLDQSGDIPLMSTESGTSYLCTNAQSSDTYMSACDIAKTNKQKAKGGGNPLTWGGDVAGGSPRTKKMLGHATSDDMAKVFNYGN